MKILGIILLVFAVGAFAAWLGWRSAKGKGFNDEDR